MNSHDDLLNTRVPQKAKRLARLALAQFPECFWMRHADAPIDSRDDVALINAFSTAYDCRTDLKWPQKGTKVTKCE